MADPDLDKKLDEGLALLRTLRPPVRRIAAVLDGGGIQLLRSGDIVYFTTSTEPDRRIYIYTVDGIQHFNFQGLSELQATLADDPRFVRVHKSFLVNLEHVSSITPRPDGRTLHFTPLPDLTIGVPSDNVRLLEAYFGVQA